MSRGSIIFADPIILPSKTPEKYRSTSKDVIHSTGKEETKPSPVKKIYSTNSYTTDLSASKRLPKVAPKVIIPKPTKPMFYIFSERADYPATITMLVIVLVTIFACPRTIWLGTDTIVTVHHVFYSGWITAVATGLGVVPFFFLTEPSKIYTGISNAIAAGMMIAASFSLTQEALEYNCEQKDFLADVAFIDPAYHTIVRTAFGVFLGLVFILSTKMFLDQHENLSLESVVGEDFLSTSNLSSEKIKKEKHQSAQKMVLIIIVMTLHSLSEGIGIGVSYGGHRGMQLGQFISLSLAVHNIPEGLAVGLVMKARKVSTLRTVLWAIFTSIPQPIFAIPAYLFIERFAPMLPCGLGFAAGAMAYVACFELFGEAMEDLQSVQLTGVMTALAFVSMMLVQNFVKDIHVLPE